MGKYDPKKLSLKHRNLLITELSQVIFKLSSYKEIEEFLKDLLTESEQIMLARRLQIAKMLLADCTYDEIRDKLKVAVATIISVKHFLDFGWGGYLKAVGKKKKK